MRIDESKTQYIVLERETTPVELATRDGYDHKVNILGTYESWGAAAVQVKGGVCWEWSMRSLGCNGESCQWYHRASRASASRHHVGYEYLIVQTTLGEPMDDEILWRG